MNSFYSNIELKELGLKKFGNNVLISRKASIYSPNLITIGSNVRIDDFCILSGEINLGSFIHISAYTALYGKHGIFVDDYCTISGRVMIYSQNDDYSGEFMTNPTVPKNLTNVTGQKIILEKHSIIGAGCIVLPGSHLGIGACLASLSLLKKRIEDFKIYGGIPAKEIGERSRELLELEAQITK